MSTRSANWGPKLRKTFIVAAAFSLSLVYFAGMDTLTIIANDNPTQINDQTKQETIDRTGLMGYYFKNEDFSGLSLIAPTYNSNLGYKSGSVDDLLNADEQTYKSIRLLGYISSKKTGDYTLNTSNDTNAIIAVNGEIISNKGNNKKTIHFEKDKSVQIRIEYTDSDPIKGNDSSFDSLQLFWTDSHNDSKQVTQDELSNPHFEDKDSQSAIANASKSSLFDSFPAKNVANDPDTDTNTDADTDTDTDTDGDMIPDPWEKKGYTIKKRVAVAWKPNFATAGYTKFVSNKFDSHTAGDPYTDYEKAARDIDRSNDASTYNPMIAAFPSVNVKTEKMIISKNSDFSNSATTTESSSHSYTKEEGFTIGGEVSAEKGPSMSASLNYHHSDTNTQEWGSSKTNTEQFNSASSAYFNANVRYHNSGTGSIYDVKPTTNFALSNQTFATVTAKSNQTALSIGPGDSYPKIGNTPIAMNTMDDFNSHPITLNKEQMTELLNDRPLHTETTQTDGNYMVIGADGNIMDGGRWNGVIQQVEAKTASIILDTGDDIRESRIAAKDFTNPEDKTPKLTIKEALLLAFPDMKEENNALWYKGHIVSEHAVQAFLDKDTDHEIASQLKDDSGEFKDVKNLYDAYIMPGMNITLKTKDLFDSGEGSASEKNFGSWSDGVYVKNGGVTGNKVFSSNPTKISTKDQNGKSIDESINSIHCIYLSDFAKSQLKAGHKYFIEAYINTHSSAATKFFASDKYFHELAQEDNIKTNGNYERHVIELDFKAGQQFDAIGFKTTVPFYGPDVDDISLIDGGEITATN